MRRGQLLFTWALVALASVALLGEAEPAGTEKLNAKGAPRVAWREIEFHTRSGETVLADSGEMEVPARWAEPAGPSLKVRFVRFPSTASEPAPPIVYLAGGPGGSGIAAAAGSRWPIFESLRSLADVIALDQRGVGYGEHLPTCTTGAVMSRSEPSTRGNLSRALQLEAQDCGKFWAGAGVDL